MRRFIDSRRWVPAPSTPTASICASRRSATRPTRRSCSSWAPAPRWTGGRTTCAHGWRPGRATSSATTTATRVSRPATRRGSRVYRRRSRGRRRRPARHPRRAPGSRRRAVDGRRAGAAPWRSTTRAHLKGAGHELARRDWDVVVPAIPAHTSTVVSPWRMQRAASAACSGPSQWVPAAPRDRPKPEPEQPSRRPPPAESDSVVPQLRRGRHVITFRHEAIDFQ